MEKEKAPDEGSGKQKQRRKEFANPNTFDPLNQRSMYQRSQREKPRSGMSQGKRVELMSENEKIRVSDSYLGNGFSLLSCSRAA